ncbi:MAG: dihydrofolate reductase [Saprospiraceae bacterium]|nr:dihydrofolate reductase [Saprospiraceae bacterium]
MTLSAIAACSSNRAIGKNNALPWHLPADMKYFMRTTKGHHVIMGKNTFESLGSPLKNRINIIITHDPFYAASGTVVVHSLQEAIDIAQAAGEEEAYIIGGAQIYTQSLDLIDLLYLTEIDVHIEDADAFFPKIALDKWELVSEVVNDPDDRNPYKYTFKVLKKKEPH